MFRKGCTTSTSTSMNMSSSRTLPPSSTSHHHQTAQDYDTTALRQALHAAVTSTTSKPTAGSDTTIPATSTTAFTTNATSTCSSPMVVTKKRKVVLSSMERASNNSTNLMTAPTFTATPSFSSTDAGTSTAGTYFVSHDQSRNSVRYGGEGEGGGGTTVGIGMQPAPIQPSPLSSIAPSSTSHSTMGSAPGRPMPIPISSVVVPPPAPPQAGYHQLLQQQLKAAASDDIPPIFQELHPSSLRSGKWTKEEEAYADLLVELFEKGDDVLSERNGSTLRGFLSRKLHCPPMRISKKYAGKGIGKMVFLAKGRRRMMTMDQHQHQQQHQQWQPNSNMMLDPECTKNMKRLEQAELAFYKKIFPHYTPRLSSLSTATTMSTTTHNQYVNVGQSFPPMIGRRATELVKGLPLTSQPFQVQPELQHQQLHQQQHLTIPVASMPTPTPLTQTSKVRHTPPQQSIPTTSRTPSTIGMKNPSTVVNHHLLRHSSSNPKMKLNSKSNSNICNARHPTTVRNPPLKQTIQGQTNGGHSHTADLERAYLGVMNGETNKEHILPGRNAFEKVQGQAGQIQASSFIAPASASATFGGSDLLTGFNDHHVVSNLDGSVGSTTANIIVTTSPATGGPSNATALPTATVTTQQQQQQQQQSKQSQCLPSKTTEEGKDISDRSYEDLYHLLQNSNNHDGVTHKSPSTVIVPPPSSPPPPPPQPRNPPHGQYQQSNADAYSLFAQQSAVAASQHSAYYTSGGKSSMDSVSTMLMKPTTGSVPTRCASNKRHNNVHLVGGGPTSPLSGGLFGPSSLMWPKTNTASMPTTVSAESSDQGSNSNQQEQGGSLSATTENTSPSLFFTNDGNSSNDGDDHFNDPSCPDISDSTKSSTQEALMLAMTETNDFFNQMEWRQ